MKVVYLGIPLTNGGPRISSHITSLAMNLLQDLCRAVASARVVPRRQPGFGGWAVWFVGEGNEVAVK